MWEKYLYEFYDLIFYVKRIIVLIWNVKWYWNEFICNDWFIFFFFKFFMFILVLIFISCFKYWIWLNFVVFIEAVLFFKFIVSGWVSELIKNLIILLLLVVVVIFRVVKLLLVSL